MIDLLSLFSIVLTCISICLTLYTLFFVRRQLPPKTIVSTEDAKTNFTNLYNISKWIVDNF